MENITTSLTSALERAINNIVDGIAKEGMQVLRQVLDKSGFRDSPYLKNYQIFSSITGQDIMFEIVLDADAIAPLDATALEDVLELAQGLKRKAQRAQTEKVARTYGLTDRGPQLIHGRRDARRPTRDARRPARDARKPARPRLKGAEDRSMEKVSMYRPRGMEVDKLGKLSLTFRRATRTTGKAAFVMPKGPLGGIPDNFIEQLKTVVASQFSTELTSLIGRYT